MSDQGSPPAADAANEDDQSDGLIRVNLRTWMAVASIPVGILFAGIAILWRDSFQDAADYRLTLCVGFGLVLSGLGTQASGKWRGWTIAGGGAAAVALYLLLYSTAAPPPKSVDPAIIARVEGGFHPGTTAVQVEAHDRAHVFTAWFRVNETLKIRLEKKNLQSGCIGLVTVVRSASGQGEEESFTYVPAAFFASAAPEIPAPGGPAAGDAAGEREAAALFYRHDFNALFVSEDSEEPVSFGRCPFSRSGNAGHIRLTASQLLLDALAPGARAGEAEISIEALIDGTKSSNALVRREARQLLGAKGLQAVEPVMSTLAGSPDDYRLQLGAVAMLSELLGTRADPKRVRAELTDADIARIVPLVAHDDKAMRLTATAAAVRLADPRAIPHLVAILDGHPNVYGRYNAAYILNQTYDSYEPAVREELPPLVRPVYDAQGPRTQSLLEPIIETAARAEADRGWVLVGVSYGKGWDEKQFAWSDEEKRPPAAGDILTAQDRSELHQDHLRFDKADGWVEAPVIGAVEPGEKLRVAAVKVVGYAFHWAEVERVE